MSSHDLTPNSLQDVWEWTREHFEAHDAAHMDAILMQIGDRVALHPPNDPSEDDRLALDAWQASGPNDRHRLTQLFMRTVGHQEFLD